MAVAAAISHQALDPVHDWSNDYYWRLSVSEVVHVGLLGCGNVGAAVVRMLADHSEEIARRAGAAVVVRRVAVRDIAKRRPISIRPEVLTTDAAEVVRDQAVDVVV